MTKQRWTVMVDSHPGHSTPDFDSAYSMALKSVPGTFAVQIDEDKRTIYVVPSDGREGIVHMAKVRLLAHTQLSEDFVEENIGYMQGVTDGEVVSLTAIRTCYSHLDPWIILAVEGSKYFLKDSVDGDGREVDRLFRQIAGSGHTSTMEHMTFTFAIKGVSRSLLAQLTRHRVGMSYSVQSQRYVKFGSKDRSGGFDYVIPPKIAEKGDMAVGIYKDMMDKIQTWYDDLRTLGVPAEDARAVLPNSAAVNLVMTANMASLVAFYSKRRGGNGAQWEIADFAEQIRKLVVDKEPWTDRYFDNAWHGKHV
jgi:thymidylate synthase (FAD)